MKILINLLIISFLSIFTLIAGTACRGNSDSDRFDQFLLRMAEGPAAASPEAPPGGAAPLNLPASGAPQTTSTVISSGTPREVTKGFCGDGIINGEEYCDKHAISHDQCNQLGGIAGPIKCDENCMLDISHCLTPAVDTLLGGVAENCRCNCDGSACSGGCETTLGAGEAKCEYMCDSNCICNCEEKLEANVQRCEFRCLCVLDDNGDPICECTLRDCDVLAVIKPNVTSTLQRLLNRQ